MSERGRANTLLEGPAKEAAEILVGTTEDDEDGLRLALINALDRISEIERRLELIVTKLRARK